VQNTRRGKKMKNNPTQSKLYPIAVVLAFVNDANVVTALFPGSRPLPFGHLGAGDIH
jgi:hypothetical protein